MMLPQCMTAHRLCNVALTVVLLGIWSLPGRSEPVHENPLSFSLEKTSLTLHEPVIVDVHITNRLSRSIAANLGENRKTNFVIVVTSPEGRRIQSYNPRREGISFPGDVNLKPGKIYSQKLVLNEWFQFDEVGTYKIEIRLAAPILSDNHELPIEPFVASFNVTERSPEQLTQICGRLLDQIKNAEFPDQILVPASALSHVIDPVAIPYLKEAERIPLVSQAAAEGLRRIQGRIEMETSTPTALSSLKEKPLAFFPTKTSVTLHEPVLVLVQILNPTSQAIDVNLGEDYKTNFVVTVTTPRGKEIRCPSPSRMGIASPGEVHLEPGDEIYSQRLLLNEWFDFEEVGLYKIDIHLASPIRSKDDMLLTDSFSTSVKITERSPEKLEAICRNLLDRITGSESYDDASAAALALSYIKDPVAVPYLKKALGSRMVTSIVTEGLKRIHSLGTV